jgi:hypothetical protein
VISPIIRTQTRVDGRGCRDEVTEFVATNLGLPIVGAEDEDFTEQLRGRDRFSWPDHKRLACLMLPFGHSYFEQVYRYDEDTKKFRLRKLAPRLPKSIAQVNVARDGGLISIQQWDSGAAFANITSAGFSEEPVHRSTSTGWSPTSSSARAATGSASPCSARRTRTGC